MTDHELGHRTSLSKLKKTKKTPIVFSNYSGMKLEINNKRKTGKVMTCGNQTTNTALNKQ